MKSLLTLVLFLTVLTLKAQVREFYVRKSIGKYTLSCSLNPGELLFSKKRIHFSTPDIDLDLKIKKRKKYYWVGETKDGCRYEIRATANDKEFGIAFIKGEQVLEVSNKDFCQ